MFDGLKGMAGMAGLMKDLPRIKEKLDEVKDQLAEMEVTAETGGGVVRVTATGKLRIKSIEIDPSMMLGLLDSDSDEDRVLAQELIAGAVNASLEKAQDAAAQAFQTAAEDLGIPIPTGGLPGLM